MNEAYDWEKNFPLFHRNLKQCLVESLNLFTCPVSYLPKVSDNVHSTNGILAPSPYVKLLTLHKISRKQFIV